VGEDGGTPDFLRGSGMLERAYALATAAHLGQTRKDGVSPYLAHPLAVASRLSQAGAEEATVAAALLHDVVEDSELTLGDMVERFGLQVAELVAALTDDRSIDSYEERKQRHREQVAEAGPAAAAIYAADKLVNVGELRDLYAEVGEAAAERLKAPIDVRLELWRGDLRMLEGLVPELSIVAELRAELDALDAERRLARHAPIG
jgi:guanosine-3',5'-bis(diphosphate) 3'-pyrophosphohydrolase